MDDALKRKIGRPRRYDLQPVAGFVNRDVGLAVAALDELLARVIDQFEDLPRDALDFAPEGTPITVAALVIHLAWAEMGWIERITGCAVPDDLRARLEPGNLLLKGEPVVSEERVTGLIELCRRVRSEITYPALATLADADVVLESGSRPMTPRAVLMHLIWHWTYHSAHIGLIRELWGSDYVWTFGNLGA